MNIYFDTEFTGLHQNTSLISIGMISDDNRIFYAEFTDYKKSQVDDWIEENVIKNLSMPVLDIHSKSYILACSGNVKVRGDSQYIAGALASWLETFDGPLHMWGDCPAYDWVLVCELFGGAMHIPNVMFYVPFDLCTYLAAKGYDPDISRKELAEVEDVVLHNALDDARMIRACWERATE